MRIPKQQQLIFGLLVIALAVLILEETVDPWMEVDHDSPLNFRRDIRSYTSLYASSGTATTATVQPDLNLTSLLDKQ